MAEIIKTYKGFDNDMKCRDFQYEVGGEYEQEGGVEACTKGFHACEYPLDVFNYYSPNTSQFCEVEQSGDISRDNSDSKVASSKIKIGAQINIAGLVKASIEYTRERTKKENDATGDRGASSATGDCGASSATGYRGASTTNNKTAVAVAWGHEGRSMGCLGAYIVCAEWKQIKSGVWKLKGAKMAKVDGKK